LNGNGRHHVFLTVWDGLALRWQNRKDLIDGRDEKPEPTAEAMKGMLLAALASILSYLKAKV